MSLFDTSLLALPLFEDRHRRLAAQLTDWVAANRELPASLAHESAAERGRLYTRVLGRDGWLAYAIDAEPGRDRPDMRAVCLIREALAQLDDLADFAFSIQGLAASPVAWFGSEEQRARYLPPMRSGALIGTLALSEPAAGSNLAAAALRADKVPGGYELHGEKTWVSNGDIADFHNVLARTGEGPGGLGLSYLLTPANASGLGAAQHIELLAPRAFSSLRFDNCKLESDALVGQSGMGFKYAMEILNFYRVTVGSASVGFCRRALEASVDWARNRDIAGAKLIQSQMAMDKLANMALYLDAASLLVARSAWEFDTGVRDVAAHASMAKLFATDGAGKVVDDTVQLFGSAGLVAGSLPEQLYRQVRALRIYEGTSEIQKIIIAGSVSRPRRPAPRA
ncbi:acyl-CoA dehydrogenase family protein [Ramlibacter sp.]|uniref:acyl-CoA dehydrogenase family protein n=1 Tax=Ramlibacter sp. TaxID=1917967 RepID=UPI0017B64BC1|nr:acyl-CoA dehydrogenase family protein [Ramlibacter sp.]MBA2672717.1 acyl-CoA dehydrogenase family protein [Ramlibacter sp.]